MHQTIIARKLIEKAKKQGKPKSIVVEVGEVSGFEPHDIKRTLDKLCDFKVVVKPVKANVRCGCGYKGRPKITARAHDVCMFECPKCGGLPRVIKGGDIVLVDVEVMA